MAYTEDGAESKNRPVTFFYNGGPGAATIWLHMGSFGPIRVITQSPDATGPAPFEWVQNPQSLIDKSDLVFIDAPLCGFSRAVGKGTAKDFAGTDQDIHAFEQFIVRYLTVNQRWNSPKFLFGESYGTTRSAGLVAALQGAARARRLRDQRIHLFDQEVDVDARGEKRDRAGFARVTGLA